MLSFENYFDFTRFDRSLKNAFDFFFVNRAFSLIIVIFRILITSFLKNVILKVDITNVNTFSIFAISYIIDNDISNCLFAR